jgi:hypothetical protein
MGVPLQAVLRQQAGLGHVVLHHPFAVADGDGMDLAGKNFFDWVFLHTFNQLTNLTNQLTIIYKIKKIHIRKCASLRGMLPRYLTENRGPKTIISLAGAAAW